ncbi:hypothetical protein ACONUD_10855 [Microbulbifer harenosus]|uniref:Uncharacterized protein n=1 Tax=Microbulbifer harenosus TaxID=2576840 RepID=A0ABY2UGC0_9GAMM|nr:hypothetical protein [Microbulbifer harenosus]TLM76587.1 hypothetical protein FDY93_12730 [Microbulbifer harenosus]
MRLYLQSQSNLDANFLIPLRAGAMERGHQWVGMENCLPSRQIQACCEIYAPGKFHFGARLLLRSSLVLLASSGEISGDAA